MNEAMTELIKEYERTMVVDIERLNEIDMVERPTTYAILQQKIRSCREFIKNLRAVNSLQKQ